MQIDFFILETAPQIESMRTICRLVEKAYLDRQQVYIHVDNPQQASFIDKLLWTYSDISFVPHQIYTGTDDTIETITIGYAQAPASHQQLLINLSANVPAFYTQFQRVVEIVFNNPTMQQLARVRYKHYRDLGHDIHTIKGAELQHHVKH